MDPIIVPCQFCEDGIHWRSKYGGNDPDVWPTRCKDCDGRGTREPRCYGFRCGAVATEWFGGEPFCATHAAREKADAVWVGEDAT